MTSIISEEGESPNRARKPIIMRLPAPSELLPEGAEGADEVIFTLLLLNYHICSIVFYMMHLELLL